MKLSLKKNGKMLLNGAFIRVDRKVNIELLNEATFLLEAHFIDPNLATTSGSQIYYLIQSMMRAPERKEPLLNAVRIILGAMSSIDPANQDAIRWQRIMELLDDGQIFKALKTAQNLQGCLKSHSVGEY